MRPKYNVRAILATGLTLAARRVGGGWGVPEAMEGFVTSLACGSVAWVGRNFEDKISDPTHFSSLIVSIRLLK